MGEGGPGGGTQEVAREGEAVQGGVRGEGRAEGDAGLIGKGVVREVEGKESARGGGEVGAEGGGEAVGEVAATEGKREEGGRLGTEGKALEEAGGTSVSEGGPREVKGGERGATLGETFKQVVPCFFKEVIRNV